MYTLWFSDKPLMKKTTVKQKKKKKRPSNKSGLRWIYVKFSEFENMLLISRDN